MTALLLAVVLAQVQPPPPPRPQQPPPGQPPAGQVPPEVQAVQPFAPLIGEHDTVTTEYGPDGRPGKRLKGVERVFPKAAIAVVWDRSTEDGYDDLTVIQYDIDARALKGFLFQPLPKPRPFDVAAADGRYVFTFPPLKLGPDTLTTRETLVLDKAGGYSRRVEHRQPDGTYRLARTVTAGPPKPLPGGQPPPGKQ
jgi:hypothetical protein